MPLFQGDDLRQTYSGPKLACGWRGRFAMLGALVLPLAFNVLPTPAAAEVRSVTEFMPASWRGDESESIRRSSLGERPSSGRSSARRAVAEEDDDDEATPAKVQRPRAKRQTGTRQTGTRQTRKRIRLAALGPIPNIVTAPRPSLSGKGISWRANSGCLASNLRAAVAYVAANFGSVTVNSTCRSKRHNRRVGGASRSYHLTGNAVDFRMRGNVRAAYAFLRGSIGGIKHYGGGRFHIDNGPRRAF